VRREEIVDFNCGQRQPGRSNDCNDLFMTIGCGSLTAKHQILLLGHD
jgi:hypothetical protein